MRAALRFLPQLFADATLGMSELLLQAETLIEAINASTGVNQLLLTGVEGMALAAYFDTDLRTSRTGLDNVAAGAGDGAIHIVGMDTCLHCVHLFQ